jgi:dGTPase
MKSEGHVASDVIRASQSRGRVHPEPPDPLREPFELDRHRLIECTAFRRLEHKTQVFAPSYHDHFRTRLTHTLEAAQIARCLARALHVNEELAEAITLAHDLGHPPFGHAGEAALNECMAGCGGFNHNIHTLRVVEYLEHPYPAFRGLNLTHETLAGLRHHATRYDSPAGLQGEGAGIEAQISSLADRVAYNCHDLEDAIGAGFLGLPALMSVALWRTAWRASGHGDADASLHALRRTVLDAIVNRVLADAVRYSQPGPATGAGLVGISTSIERDLSELEQFLFEGVYRRPEIARADDQGRHMIRSLFDSYKQDPSRLPDRFCARVDEQGLERVICDYIAGMTDRFCAQVYDRLVAS